MTEGVKTMAWVFDWIEQRAFSMMKTDWESQRPSWLTPFGVAPADGGAGCEPENDNDVPACAVRWLDG